MKGQRLTDINVCWNQLDGDELLAQRWARINICLDKTYIGAMWGQHEIC